MLQPEPLGVMTQGRLILCRRTPEQPKVGWPSIKDQRVRDPEPSIGAVRGDTLLNIPPCSMAEEPGEQSQSLFRPPMSDPELDLERQQGARPKVAGPLTTQTIQEEARAASTEEHALRLRGTDFYLPLGGQPRISERKSWRALIVMEQGNPGIYFQILSGCLCIKVIFMLWMRLLVGCTSQRGNISCKLWKLPAIIHSKIMN